jgi:hypothetical protein
MLNVQDPSNTRAAHSQGLTGAGITVGIVDTDFDVSDPQLAGRISKTVYSVGGANGNMHGTEVAEVLAGNTLGVAPGAFLQAAAAGTTGNGLLLNNQMYQDLFAKGVRIFNQSNGVSSTGASVGLALSLHALYQPYVAQQSLFIWSTGNDGAAQPTLNASLPSLFSDLQSGWLAVTAVNAVGGSNGYAVSDTVPGVISSSPIAAAPPPTGAWRQPAISSRVLAAAASSAPRLPHRQSAALPPWCSKPIPG